MSNHLDAPRHPRAGGYAAPERDGKVVQALLIHQPPRASLTLECFHRSEAQRLLILRIHFDLPFGLIPADDERLVNHSHVLGTHEAEAEGTVLDHLARSARPSTRLKVRFHIVHRWAVDRKCKAGLRSSANRHTGALMWDCKHDGFQAVVDLGTCLRTIEMSRSASSSSSSLNCESCRSNIKL